MARRKIRLLVALRKRKEYMGAGNVRDETGCYVPNDWGALASIAEWIAYYRVSGEAWTTRYDELILLMRLSSLSLLFKLGHENGHWTTVNWTRAWSVRCDIFGYTTFRCVNTWRFHKKPKVAMV